MPNDNRHKQTQSINADHQTLLCITHYVVFEVNCRNGVCNTGNYTFTHCCHILLLDVYISIIKRIEIWYTTLPTIIDYVMLMTSSLEFSFFNINWTYIVHDQNNAQDILLWSTQLVPECNQITCIWLNDWISELLRIQHSILPVISMPHKYSSAQDIHILQNNSSLFLRVSQFFHTRPENITQIEFHIFIVIYNLNTSMAWYAGLELTDKNICIIIFIYWAFVFIPKILARAWIIYFAKVHVLNK